MLLDKVVGNAPGVARLADLDQAVQPYPKRRFLTVGGDALLVERRDQLLGSLGGLGVLLVLEIELGDFQLDLGLALSFVLGRHLLVLG